MTRIGSLFSGFGGLEMGVQSVLGGTVAWHSDIDPGACRILAHRWPDVPNLGDVSTIDWTGVEPVDILTGGFPCQDVSHAGRRAGLIRTGDGRTRSGLWGEMLRAIDTPSNPDWWWQRMSEDSSPRRRIATWNRARGVWETTNQALCGHSEPFSATWPTSGLALHGTAYELPTWEQRTDASESSFSPGMPTPQATRGGSSTETAALLPTPRASPAMAGPLRPNATDPSRLEDSVAIHLAPLSQALAELPSSRPPR